jgi:hypothetical protein
MVQLSSREDVLPPIDDPDFGHLEVTRVSSLTRKPPIVTYRWQGAAALPNGTKVKLSIGGWGDKLARVGTKHRAAFHALLAREQEMRRRVAERILNLAAEWAETAERPAPTLDQLTQWLRLEIISMSDAEPTDRIVFWYEERHQDTFLGHSVIADFNLDCELTDAHLAG